MKIGNRVEFVSVGTDKVLGEVISIDRNSPSPVYEVWEGSNFYRITDDEIISTLPPKRRVKYISSFETGGKVADAKKKWRKVYREFVDGKLKHGSTGKIVKKTEVAKAIAYSEARDIYPLYGVYKNGGSPETNFQSLCLAEPPSKQDNIFSEDIFDFNLKYNGKTYLGSVELPLDEKGVAIVTWDKEKPDNWQNLESTITNRAFQQVDEKYGLGGFVAGSLLGSYVGYKIGRSMKKSDDVLKTEKKLAKGISKANKKRIEKKKPKRREALKKRMESFENAETPIVLDELKEGGRVGLMKHKETDNLFIRLANKHNSYTNVGIRPFKDNSGNYSINIIVYGIDSETDEFEIKNIRTEVISKKEKHELLNKMDHSMLLEFTSY